MIFFFPRTRLKNESGFAVKETVVCKIIISCWGNWKCVVNNPGNCRRGKDSFIAGQPNAA